MVDPYRGDGEASALRLQQFDAEIARKEKALTEVFWERVAPVWGVPDGLDEDLAPTDARHARLEILDRAIARAKKGPSAERELPAPRPTPTGLLAKLGRAAMPCPSSAAMIQSALPDDGPGEDAEWAHRGGVAWGTRVRVYDAPVGVKLTQERNAGIEARLGQASYEVGYFTTTIAPAARLTLEPEGVGQDILEMLGLASEIELDDERFDPVFVIQGDVETSNVFLDHEVRERLLAVNVQSLPRVTIAKGVATIRCAALTARLVETVMEVLLAWHRAPSPTRSCITTSSTRKASSAEPALAVI